jgi:glycerol uptake facilitator protein
MLGASGLGYSQRSFAATEDEGGKLACFSTGPAIRNYSF